MLQRVYADYKVVSTTEVNCNAAVGWVINIQNYNSGKKVKIVDSTLEEIEHINK